MHESDIIKLWIQYSNNKAIYSEERKKLISLHKKHITKNI